MNKDQNIKEFLADLERIQSNPIYFIDEYWNKLHPDKQLDLSDEEKEAIFKRHRVLVPHFNSGEALHAFLQKHDEAKSQGLKDWQIFYPKK